MLFTAANESIVCVWVCLKPLLCKLSASPAIGGHGRKVMGGHLYMPLRVSFCYRERVCVCIWVWQLKCYSTGVCCSQQWIKYKPHKRPESHAYTFTWTDKPAKLRRLCLHAFVVLFFVGRIDSMVTSLTSLLGLKLHRNTLTISHFYTYDQAWKCHCFTIISSSSAVYTE